MKLLVIEITDDYITGTPIQTKQVMRAHELPTAEELGRVALIASGFLISELAALAVPDICERTGQAILKRLTEGR